MATVWAEIEQDFQKRVQDTVKDAQSKAQSCAVRAANQLRNSALKVLRGSRSGRVYKKPGVSTRYTASAPGEPPAVRTGKLRQSWGVLAQGNVKSGSYKPGIYTDVEYAEMLDEGTPGGRIAPRPFRDRIIEDATPAIEDIFQELTR